jgi:hypothetical protein
MHFILVSHTCAFAIDHTEPESEFQVVQVKWVFGGPQASSCEDANIAMIKTSLGAYNHYP